MAHIKTETVQITGALLVSTKKQHEDDLAAVQEEARSSTYFDHTRCSCNEFVCFTVKCKYCVEYVSY
jgi:hypothetical protein